MVRNFLDEWQNLRSEIKSWKFNFENGEHQSLEIPSSITLVTGTLFAPTLKKIACEFQQLSGINTQVFSIVNDRLGDSITVAGLLMGADLLNQLKETDLGNMVVLPRVMFDHPETISLDDMPPQILADELNRPVVLADSMGDVWDAAIGTSKTIYR